MRKLYTIGYGNDKPEKFIERLKAVGVKAVIDVRREGAKSWCFSYNQGCVMSATLKGLWTWDAPELGNHFDALSGYEKWLGSWKGREAVEGLVGYITKYMADWHPICLLCAEGKPFEADGVTPRCHRVYVADALVDLLGEQWNIEHL